ncbi:MAG: DUF5009 domain-containing protein [Muribaculaceae bacterium]
MNDRAYSLDALRGYAIITMVLSATIVGGILPAWMYHAQTPPPEHLFNPGIPGLTWVDMVFPSFLFAMGAAFPFSIGKKLAKGVSKLRLTFDAIIRTALLTYFAIFIQHFYPYMLSAPQDMSSWLLAILCFALLFPTFMRLPFKMPQWGDWTVKLGAIAVGITLMLTTNYAGGVKFNIHTSNIIILILANMALFGSILYIFTYKNWKARIVILMLLMAIMLSSTISESWAASVATFNPLTWFYNFNYLKYLFIIIPGSFAGEFLLNAMTSSSKSPKNCNNIAYTMIVITLAIIISNLYCLYMRYLVLNMIISAILVVIGYASLRKSKGISLLWRNLFIAGAFMLFLGLFIEPFEGGIKKDPVNFSYLFTTAGLSFYALIFFSVVCDYFKCTRSTSFLVMSGQNPMIAYVAGDLLLMPLLNILGLYSLLGIFHISPVMGFLQGVILTTCAVLVTMFFTKIKWFWRT